MSVSESLKLGAYDLKKYANKSLAIGFAVAFVIVVGLTGGGSKAFEAKETIDTVEYIATGPTTMDDFIEEDLEAAEPPPPEEYVPPPPPPPAAAVADVGSGSEGRMGQIVATTEEVEGPDVADMSEMEFADVEGGGDGGAAAFDPDAFEIPDEVDLSSKEPNVPTQQETYPEFVPDAKPPQYSPAELMANATYPSIARENGLEGTVHIMVFLSKTGKVDKVQVLKSDNKVFDDEAIAAVKKTQFSPAIQNGIAINYKFPVRVKFELD